MRSLPFLLAALLAAAPASAQLITIESSNPLPKTADGGDLNRVICEKVQRTGSRLEFDKVCMTALQWKEHQQGHREDFEKVQQVVNLFNPK